MGVPRKEKHGNISREAVWVLFCGVWFLELLGLVFFHTSLNFSKVNIVTKYKKNLKNFLLSFEQKSLFSCLPFHFAWFLQSFCF